MKKSKFTEEQIVYAIKQVEVGVPIVELCRKYGISQQTFYRWRNKYGGLAPSELKRLKKLERDPQPMSNSCWDLAHHEPHNPEFFSFRIVQSWGAAQAPSY